MKNKAIIYTRFRRMAIILDRELQKWNPVLVHGEIKGEERARRVQKFKTDESVRLLIATEAFSEGLNLEEANIVVHFDLPYSYGKYVQRNGRIARLTQQKPMMVYNLIARKSMDEKVARIIANKQDLSEMLLGRDVREMLM